VRGTLWKFLARTPLKSLQLRLLNFARCAGGEASYSNGQFKELSEQ